MSISVNPTLYPDPGADHVCQLVHFDLMILNQLCPELELQNVADLLCRSLALIIDQNNFLCFLSPLCIPLFLLFSRQSQFTSFLSRLELLLSPSLNRLDQSLLGRSGQLDPFFSSVIARLADEECASRCGVGIAFGLWREGLVCCESSCERSFGCPLAGLV